MRHVQMIKKCLVGSRVMNVGERTSLDDKIAARIVGAGHASYLAVIQGGDEDLDEAADPKPAAAEKAVARKTARS